MSAELGRPDTGGSDDPAAHGRGLSTMTAAARSDDESGTAHLGRFHQDASERWSVTAEVMAQALGGRRAGSAWMARCPAHDDHVPSLAIDERSDGTVLVCGHAGCSQHAVINALTARGCGRASLGDRWRRFQSLPGSARSGAPAEPDARRRRDVDLASERAPQAPSSRPIFGPVDHAAAPEGAESSCQQRRQERGRRGRPSHDRCSAACSVPRRSCERGGSHRLRPAGGAHMHAHDHEVHRPRSSGAALRPHGPRRPHRRRCRRCQGHVATRHCGRERVMRTPPFLVRPVSTHPKDAGRATDRTHGTPRTRRTTPSSTVLPAGGAGCDRSGRCARRPGTNRRGCIDHDRRHSRTTAHLRHPRSRWHPRSPACAEGSTAREEARQLATAQRHQGTGWPGGEDVAALPLRDPPGPDTGRHGLRV